MPIIQVQMFEGRTPEQKKALVEALTQATMQALGSKPESVQVILTDVARSHWAKGGVLMSEAPTMPTPPAA